MLNCKYHSLSCSRFLSGLTLLGAIICSSFSLAAHADVKAALPAASGSLKLTQPPMIYTPATLENHIDGEAEAVKHYDFKQCAYGAYAPQGKGNPVLTVDIFEMGDYINAYGFYSSQRNATAKIQKIGADGYEEASALNFWKGAYYVRITITASNPAAFKADMSKIGQAVAAKLTGATTTPAIINLLPAGYSPRTEQYRRSDIAAQSYIRNGVVARYPAAGRQAELFVAIYPSPAAAKVAYGKYSAYLTRPANMAPGARVLTIRGIGDSAVGVKSHFSGEVVAAAKGKYLIGMRYASDQVGAQKLVREAVARAK